jgi:hypothetical protein
MKLEHYISKKLFRPTAIAILSLSFLVFLGQLLFLGIDKRSKLLASLSVASATIEKSIEARDWDISLRHIESLTQSTGLFDASVKYANGETIAGPVGKPNGIQLGAVCGSVLSPDKAIKVEGCLCRVSEQDIYYLLTYLVVLVIFAGAFFFVLFSNL